MCDICDSASETKYLPLFVSGSEGIDVCFLCEMSIVNFVRAMESVSHRSKLNVYKKIKERRKNEQGKKVDLYRPGSLGNDKTEGG